jgi:hypothetical protein
LGRHLHLQESNKLYSILYLLDVNNVHLELNTYCKDKLSLEAVSIAQNQLRYVWVAQILVHNQNIGEKITELQYSLDA